MKRKNKTGNRHAHSRILTPAERALWAKVQGTIVKSSNRAQTGDTEFMDEAVMAPQSGPSLTNNAKQYGTAHLSYTPPMSTAAPRRPATIDDRTARKLHKGKLAIEAVLDLHGMTQERAHLQLMQFLAREKSNGSRMVLIITGKGKSGAGILRDLVPDWIRQQPMASLVSGFRQAARNHGGSGALYVRLRHRS